MNHSSARGKVERIRQRQQKKNERFPSIWWSRPLHKSFSRYIGARVSGESATRMLHHIRYSPAQSITRRRSKGRKERSFMQIASWFRVIEVAVNLIPTCTECFVISVQQLPSFSANLLVIGMWRRQPSFFCFSFAARSISSQQSAIINPCHFLLTENMFIVYGGEEDEGETKRNEKS